MITPSHLVNEHFDDRYFDVVSALDEARQIFFVYNDLPGRIEAAGDAPLVIGEAGFGAGRNVVALQEFLRESGRTGIRIDYHSVELFPMGPERMGTILEGFRERAGEEIDALLAAYRGIDVATQGPHHARIERPFGTIALYLWIGEALEMVRALVAPCDVWFLDGHGPKKNPDMWRPELLAEIGRKTEPGGSCSTFTVARVVRDGLEAAGFTLEKLPGCGGKKEVLKGVHP